MPTPADPIKETKTQKQIQDKGLSTPQLRVMKVLSLSRGPITRAKISDWIGNKTQVVAGRAIGYSDPEKRAAFEATADGGFRKSLLSLGYVREIELDIDGEKEIGVELTEAGREAFSPYKDIELPGLRDSYADSGKEKEQQPDSGS